MSAQAAPTRMTAQATEGGVLFKLVLFSLALGVVPLGSYFGSEKYIWDGNSTYAAITAIVGANLVLVGYILLSFADDRKEKAAVKSVTDPAKARETRKDR